MRLLNTETLELCEFFDSNVPVYAILSHRWQDAELTFNDMKPKHRSRLPTKPGFAKIEAFCTRARADDYQYCWVDTVCISKTSSSELAESINSMYRWYANAGACYVYLADVLAEDSHADKIKAFRHSTWHTRGWTLQELLAPSPVVFLDSAWQPFGTKRGLATVISEISGIHERFLVDTDRISGRLRGFRPSRASVAQKMSWAATRQTSREEDMAYCLLGLFDLNMPLLYGEGNRAFLRLQQEIISATDDESVFAWQAHGLSHSWPLLATSPRVFATSHNISLLRDPYQYSAAHNFYCRGRPPYNMTNKGLQIQGGMLVAATARTTTDTTQHRPEDAAALPDLFPLSCICTDIPTPHFLAIALDSRRKRRKRPHALYVVQEHTTPSSSSGGGTASSNTPPSAAAAHRLRMTQNRPWRRHPHPQQNHQQPTSFTATSYDVRILEDVMHDTRGGGDGSGADIPARYRWLDRAQGEADGRLAQLYLVTSARGFDDDDNDRGRSGRNGSSMWPARARRAVEGSGSTSSLSLSVVTATTMSESVSVVEVELEGAGREMR